MARARSARLTLEGGFAGDDSSTIPAGDYTASSTDGRVRIEEAGSLKSRSTRLTPVDFDTCRFTLHDVTIGIDFHWEQKEEQTFQGSVLLQPGPDGLAVVNELPLESYLISVISSEMSASCPLELLRAHAIVSRSWFLANVFGENTKVVSDGALRETARNGTDSRGAGGGTGEIIRWYGRGTHSGFDVCADDHCQRYQGITRAFSDTAFNTVRETRGQVLVFGDEICDARYSKSCGGVTEVYRSAWEDRDVPYLQSAYDGPGSPDGYAAPFTIEGHAERWITTSPPAYCNTRSRELLERILPGYDQKTHDFYRWRVDYSNEELSEILHGRIGEDFGRLIALEPLERGRSGRIVRLKIVGEKKSSVIGKELEIRRALSRSHLYSSAFVVRGENDGASRYPRRFTLIGAGWGHGVGMCQIGAAVMADAGRSHEEIFTHYFRGTALQTLY